MIETMVTLLLALLLVIIIVMVVNYILGLIGAPQPAQKIAMAIIGLLFLVWLLGYFGLYDGGHVSGGRGIFVAHT